MTEHDIERLLHRWFAERPTEMPDRVLDVVADRIARQAQRPAWRLQWRLLDMNPLAKVVAAVAAVVLIAVVGWRFLPGATNPGLGSVPTTGAPSAAPTASPPPLPGGPLEARDYVARAIAGDSMAFTITAPEGWTGLGGWFLAGPDGSAPPGGIAIAFNRDPDVVTDPCDSTTHPAVTPSVADLVAALSAREDLEVSGVTDTELGGYSGTRLDIQLPATLSCNHYVFAEPKGLYANGPSNRWRVWLLDVEGSTAVVVLLDHAATPADVRATAEAAVQSIRITP